jgi:hypothetical protein
MIGDVCRLVTLRLAAAVSGASASWTSSRCSCLCSARNGLIRPVLRDVRATDHPLQVLLDLMLRS